MELIIIRHTNVDLPKGICYGQKDVSLKKDYLSDFEQIKQQLGNENINTILTSPLSRCTQLANYLSEYYQSNVLQKAALKELNFGSWEGISWEKIYHSDEGQKWFKDYWNMPCPGGESFYDLLQRTKSILDELNIQKNQKCLIITHSGPIRCFYHLIKQKPLAQLFNLSIPYGSITRMILP